MPSIINTNLPSINTQRNLNTSQASLNTAIQRLSSGLRVNSAKDDAAGLAIAERMNAQVRGLNVAARNAMDGVSLAQTAEGALGKIGEMVQRVRELAVQSSNATNSLTDRKALQAEVTQLTEEIDRVAKTTNFNGTKLLDGSFAAARFQVGADAGESITIAGITNASLDTLGATMSASLESGAITAFGDVTAGDFQINGTSIGALPAVADANARKSQLVQAINAQAETTGVHAFYDADEGKVMLYSNEDITITATGTATAAAVGFADAATDAAASTSFDALDITRFDQAQLAIQQADAALKDINSARATLGALQSRFESAVSNIQIAAENTTAARSRIMDTDFAAETANMTRAQILQQAGNAMLSQANQLPQQVLSLLKG